MKDFLILPVLPLVILVNLQKLVSAAFLPAEAPATCTERAQVHTELERQLHLPSATLPAFLTTKLKKNPSTEFNLHSPGMTRPSITPWPKSAVMFNSLLHCSDRYKNISLRTSCMYDVCMSHAGSDCSTRTSTWFWCAPTKASGRSKTQLPTPPCSSTITSVFSDKFQCKTWNAAKLDFLPGCNNKTSCEHRCNTLIHDPRKPRMDLRPMWIVLGVASGVLGALALCACCCRPKFGRRSAARKQAPAEAPVEMQRAPAQQPIRVVENIAEQHHTPAHTTTEPARTATEPAHTATEPARAAETTPATQVAGNQPPEQHVHHNRILEYVENAAERRAANASGAEAVEPPAQEPVYRNTVPTQTVGNAPEGRM